MLPCMCMGVGPSIEALEIPPGALSLKKTPFLSRHWGPIAPKILRSSPIHARILTGLLF